MKFMLIILCVVALAMPALAENLLSNADFEHGDLAGVLPRWWTKQEADRYPLGIPPGWTEAGPKTVGSWQGGAPVPLQFFTKNAPMYVHELSFDDRGEQRAKRVAVALHPVAKTGYSIGWALAGLNAMGHPYVSQMITIPPGKYLLKASWDVAVDNQLNPGKRHQTAGVFQVNVDQWVGQYDVPKPAFEKVVWNEDSKGKWLSQAVNGHLIETRTGGIEVRLMFRELGNAPIPADKYSFVAFDNVVVELLHVR